MSYNDDNFQKLFREISYLEQRISILNARLNILLFFYIILLALVVYKILI